MAKYEVRSIKRRPKLTNKSLNHLLFSSTALFIRVSTDNFSLPIKDAAFSDSWWVCCRGMKEILSEAMPVQNQKFLATVTERTVMFPGRQTEMKFQWFSCLNSRTRARARAHTHIHIYNPRAVNPAEKWSVPLLFPVRAPPFSSLRFCPIDSYSWGWSLFIGRR